MIRFSTKEEKKLFMLSFPGQVSEGMSSDEFDSLLLKFQEMKNNYLTQITDYKRSIRQKMNWKKYRLNYQIGINRFNRSAKGQNARRKAARTAVTRVSRGGDNEKYSLNLLPYERNYFLESIYIFKRDYFKDMTYYSMEEDFIESQAFAMFLQENLLEFEKHLMRLKEDCSEAELESFFILIGHFILDETYQELKGCPLNHESEQSYVSVFEEFFGKEFESKTIKEDDTTNRLSE